MNQEVWMWMSPPQVVVFDHCHKGVVFFNVSVSGLVGTQGDVVYCDILITDFFSFNTFIFSQSRTGFVR